MKILDMIKRLFYKNKALPEGRSETTNNLEEKRGMVIQRQDGTTIEISPVLDKLGNQQYEQVFNTRTNEMQFIPKYDICCEELKRIIHPQILKHTVLMDIDYSLLQEQYYADYVANEMLNSDRMEKVVNQYQNYVGGIRTNSDKNGIVLQKYIDQGIINSLIVTTKENEDRMNRERIARDIEERQKITENAQNHEVHYKTQHAEDLSKYSEEVDLER